MEIKATLNKPYSENNRKSFIVQYNHNLGYEIKETETALEAWGYTQEEKEQQEAQRIAQLNRTKRDVFLILLQDKGITPEQIRAQIQDESAKIEFDYSERFYRGNPLIDQIGTTLGYTKEQLDYIFEYGEVPPAPEPEPEDEETPEEEGE